MGDIGQIFSQWFGVYLKLINDGLKFFFNDMPLLFGLRLGYWFLIVGFLTLFMNWVLYNE